ncbi:hypothetical protein GGR56DRAFT_642844 [Xylariaceae sp. FL0804]|nr:hypothetical protein GGR56DRAFT_642844 [Xylariaceae sp. FL0804]
MASAAKGAAGDYINALFIGDEHYTPEDGIASAPSSYRRIRKSRSMFTNMGPNMASRGYDGNNLPQSTSLPWQPDDNVRPANLKAPKSMSFLRNRRNACRAGQDDVPVMSSTKEFVGTLKGKRRPLKPQSSAFYRSSQASQDSTFKRSMRDSSNSSTSTDVKFPKDGSLRRKARKASQNFKHKLKNFLGMAKGDNDEASFPAQQIEARRSRVAGIDYAGEALEENFRPASLGGEGALSRVTSGVPSLHAVPSYQQLRSRQGSLESLRSMRKSSDERSRVTSWSNSDTNTFNTASTHRGERERQRLSIINEHGTHVSSSSARRHNVSNRAIYHSTSAASLRPPVPPQPVTVDSQRIYSALMKKLDDDQKRAQADRMQRQRSIDSFMTKGTVPSRGSSLSSHHRVPPTPTIRHVVSPSESEGVSGQVIKRKPLAGSKKPDNEVNASGPQTSAATHRRPGITPSASAPLAGGPAQSKTPDWGFLSVPSRGEPPSSARTLSARSSAFFGSPTCHLFRTQSPYRRALQGTIKTAEEEAQPKTSEYNPWMSSLSSLPIRCPSTCESEIDKKMEYTESIYSSNADDNANSASNTAPLVDGFPKPPSVHGDATIFLDTPSYKVDQPVQFRHRVTSSSGSSEWKNWLSANVAKLRESSIHPSIDPAHTYRPGHVRETAQVNDDEEDLDTESYGTAQDQSVPSLGIDGKAGSPPSVERTVDGETVTSELEKEDQLVEVPPLPKKSSLRTRSSTGTIPCAVLTSRAEVCDEARCTPRPDAQSSFGHANSLSVLSGGNQSGGRGAGPARFVKLQSRPRDSPTPSSSPGLASAVEKQFRKVSSSTDSRRRLNGSALAKSENVSPHLGRDDDPYGIEGAGVLGPGKDVNGRTTGSQRMVDLFLSSRRRRMTSSNDGAVFL